MSEPNLALGDAFFGIFGMSRKDDAPFYMDFNDEGDDAAVFDDDEVSIEEVVAEFMRIMSEDDDECSTESE